MKKIFWCALLVLILFNESYAKEGRILRFPNASKTQITFVHGGDVFVVSRDGGLARKITSSEGTELFPRFSPDGTTIAFSGEYDGNREIYTIPSEGGEPKRITYSMDIPGLPDRMGPDKIIMQWTADGKKILYRARGEFWNAWVGKLFYIDKDGGLPEELPLPAGGFGTLSPDGSKLAYNRIFREFRTWKRYRGGQVNDVWIYDFNTKKVENVTNNPAQDIIPMWYKDKIYFMSDRDKIMNIFCYDLNTKETKKITNFDKYDVKYASIGPDNIAFENAGYLYILDLTTDQIKKIDIQIAEDFPVVRTKDAPMRWNIANMSIAPDGKRALFSARGDVFSVPAEKGNIRNLTNTIGVHDRNAHWSPDGKWIAYISDETGETEIFLVKPDGTEKTQLTSGAVSYRYDLQWSPDSKKIVCSDKAMQLYYIDVESKKVRQITKSKDWEITDIAWSPDSKWITYADFVDSPYNVIFIYSLESGKSTQVTSEFFDSGNPEFSSDGKYLFFVSNRTYSADISEIEWNFDYHNMARIYGITLQSGTASPFIFESDEVAIKDDTKDADKSDDSKDKKSGKKKDKSEASESKDNKDLKIDLDGIKDRLFSLPLDAGNYFHLTSIDNKLYYTKGSSMRKFSFNSFDFTDKKENEVGDFSYYDISSNGKKILFSTGRDYYISDLKEKVKPGDNKLNLDDMEKPVDRRAEWAQIYNESWRQMRDFFYDPNMHGVDWAAMKDKYGVLLPYVDSRADLTYLIGELIAELNVGHAYVGGGDLPHVPYVGIGLLGADYKLDSKSGFYKITKILKGRNWEEKTRSPLTEPGFDIHAGDYLISVDGQKLTSDNTPFKALVNKVNDYVTLKINTKPSEDGAKEFHVKTISNETDLRYFNWVDHNRHIVDSVTNGQIGYIHIPDMGVGNGLNEFAKYFYPLARKKALIVDDRYNGGGNVSPMIIERLRRILLVAKHARNQTTVGTNPDFVMTGPMVCLINELSASDGDLFPYQFKQAGLGKLIGKRSWGGVIGIRGSLPFIDGGYMTKPEFANFGANGTWVLEGVGMTPDIEVDNDPATEYNGMDQQLLKAIEVVQEEMKTDTKPKVPEVPTFPNKK